MIEVEDINPFSLPSVALSIRSLLPYNRAIYFVLAENNEILYIGKANRLVKRWCNHHRLHDLESLEKARIAWLNCNDVNREDLHRIEQECLLHFQPRLNSNGTIHPLHLRVSSWKKQREERYRQNTVAWQDIEPFEVEI